MEGRPGGGRTHAQGKRAGEATTACRLRSCRQLDYLLLPPTTDADDDGSVALESGGGGGVMVCGPSYFHGEERGRERERGREETQGVANIPCGSFGNFCLRLYNSWG